MAGVDRRREQLSYLENSTSKGERDTELFLVLRGAVIFCKISFIHLCSLYFSLLGPLPAVPTVNSFLPAKVTSSQMVTDKIFLKHLEKG